MLTGGKAEHVRAKPRTFILTPETAFQEEYDSDLTFLQNLQEAENLHLSSVFYPLIMKVDTVPFLTANDWVAGGCKGPSQQPAPVCHEGL
ncbi:hypothetical protein WJX75_000501 [Coccomyxa subellipsoidea]|uniref:Uncharacterized protein n=1 Tax=Coccomyxa subellipsoidea TaxID=248742 RepID=A0ABR2YIR0_9CHLO